MLPNAKIPTLDYGKMQKARKNRDYLVAIVLGCLSVAPNLPSIIDTKGKKIDQEYISWTTEGIAWQGYYAGINSLACYGGMSLYRIYKKHNLKV